MPEWPVILMEHGPTAWRTAYRILGNRADADDCLQEACIAAVRFSRRNQVENWCGLLVRLVIARSVDRIRERRRSRGAQAAANLDSVAGGAPSPLQAAEESELAERLRSALACLAPSQAEAFCLHCLEGWSYEEVARHMSVSTDAVGVHLHRARRRLRELLAEFEGRQILPDDGVVNSERKP